MNNETDGKSDLLRQSATMKTVYDSDHCYDEWKCEITIINNEITVSYEEDDDVHILYKGSENGDGHYQLKCHQRNGNATLHRFPKSRILEGYWNEDGYTGMWRIQLE